MTIFNENRESPGHDRPHEDSLLSLTDWGKWQGLLRSLVIVGLTGLVLLLLFRHIDVHQVLVQLGRISTATWAISTLLALMSPLLSALRWRLTLKTMGHDIPFWRCLLIIVGIWPLSIISPSKIGDLLKAVSLRREIQPTIVIGSVLTERALDVLILALFALGGSMWFREPLITAIALAAALGVAAVIAVARLEVRLSSHSLVQEKLTQITMSLKALSTQPRLLTGIVLLTIANWFASILQTQFLFWGLDASVHLMFTIGALPVALFAGLLPITLAGLGTRDAAMLELFAGRATSTQILAVSLLYSFFGYWLIGIIGLPLMRKALDG